MLNDKDIDVLIGRYAKGAAKGTPVEHPDADELNAFAEGALPPSARQRYLSHFADCDDCRKLVSQLAVTTGAGVEVRIPAFEPVPEPWWKKLSTVFAIPTLRYAAFGIVLLAVGGIAFLAWRQPAQRNPEIVAQHQPQTSPVEDVKPALTQEPGVTRNNENTQPSSNTPIPQPTVSSTSDQNRSGLTTVSPPPPPKSADDVLAAKDAAPVVAGAARSDDAARAQSTPSYAPAPTETYKIESRERAQQSPGPGGPRRSDSYDKYKTIDCAQTGDFAKGRDEDRNRTAANQPASENKQEDSRRARTESQVATVSPKSVGELRSEARKSAGTRSSSEETPETRSVGGRKFKRQGNAWVDSKLKSSMSVRTVGRGSEEFDKLDSGLRSIAKQLSGEIVVVWKGKAYRIR
ncbi:MAG TPA: zf-HC2 domain-containing protein [Pyrinomonadaceae bacterium]|nr:zf-HC2 domain-containing protein [Pyrinomonadaceae bacterium]